MNIVRGLLCSGLLVAGGATEAHDEVPTGLREGFYAAPMYSYSLVDARRQTDDGKGYALALGHRWEFSSVELRGEFLSLARNDKAGDAKLSGGFIGLQLAPFRSLRVITHLYGTLSFGTHSRKNHPGFSDGDTVPIEAGLGHLFPFELFGFDLAARLEALYRLDTQQPPFEAGEPRKFEDYLFHVGLQVPLSRAPKPAPEPAPAPPAVVPPAIGDSDQDGVNDDRDQCPDTPSGSFVNNVGCPQEPEPAQGPLTLATAQAGDTIVLTGVNFEFNKAQLTANARVLLDGVAQQLAARPELTVEIGGHTDGRGSDIYNQSLSEQRADSVRRYLIEQGVTVERLTSVGYGESKPVDSNDTDEGRERNRRVELKVLDSGAPGAISAPSERDGQ